MPSTSSPSWSSAVRREVLANGLTILIQRDESAPVAAVVTHVKAGFFDEPDRWAGISHVLEHMFFKGTPTRGVGRIARETKAAGGYLNASTSYDQTSYYVVLPAARLAQAVEIQADALMHALIDPVELGRELQVIIQEARRKLDHPGAVTQETLHEVMFDRHRIRRWRIGTERDLAGFTREDVHGYYRTRYVPGRTVVAIVGDVDVEAALALARERYGAWPAAEGAVDPSPDEPPRREVRARTLRGDVTLAELAVGWRGVPPLDPLAVPLDLAAAVLGAGRGSWLYRALRETGLATSVSAFHYAPTELGVFGIAARADADRMGEVTGVIGALTRRLAAEGPGAEDLERARTLLLARWARRMEEMDGRAESLAQAEALGGVALLDREYRELEITGAEAVRKAAARILDPGAVSAVTYLPRGRGAELTADALRAAFASPTEMEAARLPPAAPARARAPDRTAGRTGPGAGVMAGVHRLALPAFDLLVRRKPGVPLATLAVYLPRAAFDPPGQSGLTALTVRSAVRGAGGLDAAALAHACERLGGTLAPSVTLDWVGYGISVMAPHLASAAALLDLVLREPRFAPKQVAAERALLVDETSQVADDMFRYPFQLAFAAAFGDQAYGVPALGLPGDLAGLADDAPAAWHLRALGTPRGVVVAVGDLVPDQALQSLEAVFGAHPARPAARLDQPVRWALSGPASRETRREKAQTAFALAFPGPDRRDPARLSAEVWSAVASGLGGRLFEALRDRRSLAYTVMASSWQKARAGALLSYIATAPAREEEARREMLRELERFAAERVSPEELAQATEYLAGQTEVHRQSGSAVAGEILEAWLAGGGLEELEGTAERYREVTAEAVRAVAERTLATGIRAEGVVRGTGEGR